METHARKLSDWVTSYQEYMAISDSPPEFTKWAAISAIAAALERKVWCYSNASDLFPNLYVILVGPPAVGKSKSITPLGDMVRDMKDIHIAPTSVTKASLVDALKAAERGHIIPPTGALYQFNSLYLQVSELGVLIPKYETDFMNTLTTLYDCISYSETRRTKSLNILIANPQLNFIGCTTPGYMNSSIPVSAWQEGFLSRVILVYSGEKIYKPLFTEELKRKDLFNDLQHDLEIISRQYGKVGFSPEAAAAIETWYKAKCPPIPDHPKLAHYLGRRSTHLLKLCMVACYAKTIVPVITLEHYETALQWLLDAETAMPDIFKAMDIDGGTKVFDEAHHYVWQWYAKHKRPMSNPMLTEFVSFKVPSHSIAQTISLMERMEYITPEIIQGVICWKPLPKGPR